MNLLGTYPGSLGNFGGMQRGIPVLTIELRHAGIMPSPGEISAIWVDMIRWLKQNMPEDSSTDPVDLEKELRLAFGDQAFGNQNSGDGVLGDENNAGDNDILN